MDSSTKPSLLNRKKLKSSTEVNLSSMFNVQEEKQLSEEDKVFMKEAIELAK